MAELLTITGNPGAGAAPSGAPHSQAEPGAPVPAALSIPPSNAPSRAPSHCGAPMEWAAPALAAMSAYSFGGGPESSELPPVWRCSCGFQLDGIVHTSNALAALS